MNAWQKAVSETWQQANADSEILERMATDLREGRSLPFSPTEMADLLDRIREEHYAHLL